MGRIERLFAAKTSDSLELGSGLFFMTSDGAAAAVMVNGSGQVAISFRGTDDFIEDLPDRFDPNYWREFLPLIQTVATVYSGKQPLLVGHSLGGHVVHQLTRQWLADEVDFGFSRSPLFFSTASPSQAPASFVSTLGFSNDPVFEHFAATGSRDLNLWANTTVDFRTSYSLLAHSQDAMESALLRAQKSGIFGWAGDSFDWRGHMVVNFFNRFTPEFPFSNRGALAIFGMDAPIELEVRDSKKYFSVIDDVIDGRNNGSPTAIDFIDGMAGDDVINAAGGYNVVYGGVGNDTISVSHNLRSGTFSRPASSIFGGAGNDRIEGANMFGFGDSGDDLIVVTPTGTSTYYWLHGGAGNDILDASASGPTDFRFFPQGGSGNDTIILSDALRHRVLWAPNDANDRIIASTAGADLDLQVVFTNYNLDFAIMDRRYYFDAGDMVSTDSGAMTPFQTRFYDNVGANQFAAVQSDTTVEVRMNSTGSRENFLYLADANGGSRVIVERFGKKDNVGINLSDGPDEIIFKASAFRDIYRHQFKKDLDFAGFGVYGFDPGEDSVRVEYSRLGGYTPRIDGGWIYFEKFDDDGNLTSSKEIFVLMHHRDEIRLFDESVFVLV